jgi:hypothetical protein
MRYWQSNVGTKSVPAHTNFTQFKYGRQWITWKMAETASSSTGKEQTAWPCDIYDSSLPNGHPHLLVVYPFLTNEEMTTESQQYNCFIRNGGNGIP